MGTTSVVARMTIACAVAVSVIGIATPHRGCRAPQATQIRMHGRPSRLRMPANGFAKGSSRGAHNVPRLAE